jgi:beta-galactosidase
MKYGENAIAPRTKDDRFMGYVKTWLDVLLPKIHSLLYSNGGPIIMIQVKYDETLQPQEF